MRCWRFEIMKLLIIACLGVALLQSRAGTLVAPNGLENVEGNTSGASFGISTPGRTQIIFGSQHFSLFSPDGANISELRFRVDGPNGFAFSASVDMEVHLSITTQNPNQLDSVLSANVGVNETVVLPRTIIAIGSEFMSVGPNAFSIAIPLPNQFFYKPTDGNLLMDLFVHGINAPRGFPNLDWQGGNSDGVSAAVAPLVPGTSIVSASGLVTQFVFSPVPEPSITLFTVLGGTILLRRKLCRC
jgi:hypothetical protein